MNLETLSILLEVSGGKAVIKELNGVEQAVSKTEKAANKSETVNRKLGQGYRDLRVGIMRAIAPLAAFAVIINRTLDFSQQGENLLFMANSAGIAADNFASLALAAERLGGSRQGMAAVMGSLSAGIMGLRRGEENQLTNAAMYYGVSLKGKNGLATPEEMLYNIANAMQGRSGMEQADMARMLGLDEGTFRLVQQGVSGIRKELEMADKYNPFKNEETMRNIRTFQYTLRDIKMAFGMLTGQLATDLLPHFQRWADISKQAIDYLIEHGDAVKLVLVGIGGVILSMLGPWGLLLGIVGLLIDDFATFKQGGESLFEPMWKSLDTLLEKLADLQVWFENNSDKWWMKALTRAATTVLNPIAGMKEGVDAIGSIDYGKAFNQLAVVGPSMGGAVFNTTITNNINEAGDASKTEQAVYAGLQRSGISDAADQAANGVKN